MNAETESEPAPPLSLRKQITLQIQSQGPMSLATYMGLCLTHPKQGYYKKADPLGAAGDFVTAPEISQMFGEMLGAFVLMQWHKLQRPQKFDLVELGPGRATLMSDMMRTIALDKDAMAATNIVLLETNPVLINKQRESLQKFSVSWISEIADLKDTATPLIVIANEFFDALPIQQYQFQNGAWHERLIGLDGEKLVWGLSLAPVFIDILSLPMRSPKEGAIFEFNILAQKTIASLSQILNRRLGAMIIFDYGHDQTRIGESFQAVADHKFADPLDNPGFADLSAHVDFESLIFIARQQGTEANFAGTQGQVLSDLGIGTRAKHLMKSNPARSETIKADLDRLVGEKQMGKLFKTMTLSGRPDAPPRELDRELNRHPAIIHGFFGRNGGGSSGEFSSLNVSLATKDQRANIFENRKTIVNSLDLPFEKLATLSQTHSARVITLNKDYDFQTRPEADGFVTRQQQVTLGILTADCTPVLLADIEAGVIGACHAGWKGAVAGIVGNTVLAMENIGAEADRIIAVIGPTIWAQNYEVGPQFAAQFLALHPKGKEFISTPANGQREHFDLPRFVLNELKKSGVPFPSQVGGCTYAHPDRYFSFRYSVHNNQNSGRQFSIIALK